MPDKGFRSLTIKIALAELIESQPDFRGNIPSYLDKLFRERQKNIEIYKNSANPSGEFVSFILSELPNIPAEQVYEILHKTLEYLQKNSSE